MKRFLPVLLLAGILIALFSLPAKAEAITSLSFQIPEPTPGGAPAFAFSLSGQSAAKCRIYSENSDHFQGGIRWIELSGGAYLSSASRFEAGGRYRCEFLICPANGADLFSYSLGQNITVNGITAKTSAYQNNSVQMILLVKADFQLPSAGGGEIGHTHAYTSQRVEKEPGCETEGVRVLTCSCGEEIREAIPAAGHDLIAVPETPATCLEEGAVAHYECEICGALFTYPEKTPCSDASLAIPKKAKHEFSYRFDENSHWQECACGEKKEKSSHDFGGSAVCSVCGYRKGASPDPTTSARPEPSSAAVSTVQEAHPTFPFAPPASSSTAIPEAESAALPLPLVIGLSAAAGVVLLCAAVSFILLKMKK